MPVAASRPAEATVAKVYPLKYADVQTVMSSIIPVAPEAQITLNDRNNSLIVLASGSTHERVEELIELLDVPPDRDQDQRRQMIVYPLQHIDPVSALGALEFIVSSAESVAADRVQINADERNNRILVYGPLKTHMQVKELLAKVDGPPDIDAGFQLKVFQVVHAEAEAMADVVLELLQDDRVNISVDLRTNSVLATGPEGVLEIIEALLLRLDEAEGREKGRRPSATHYVRVVWFTDGPVGEKTVELDNQMLMIEAEMAKIGVKGIHPVAQVMVGTTSGGDFNMDCTLTLADGPVEFKVSGKLDMPEDTPHVTIELAAAREHDPGIGGQAFQPVQLADLSTEIVAPFDHFVVLGVAPLEKMTSIFAVQVRQGM